MENESIAGQGVLWGITTFFNPQRYKNKYQNYVQFREGTRQQGLKLLTVECAFGNQPFELTHKDADVLVQVRSNSILWQKERLLNIGLQNLPQNCDTFAWLDCDLIFLNNNWIRDTQQLLQKHKVVQLFEYAVCLKKDAKIQNLDIHTLRDGRGENEISEGYAKRMISKSNKDYWARTGFGWAARKEIFDTINFYDRMIIGSSDFLFALSFFENTDMYTMFKGFITEKELAWYKKMHDRVQGDLNYVPGYVLHLWHGSPKNRLYSYRHIILSELGFNAERDICLNEYGCWEWNTKNHRLINFVRDYFGMRNEEGSLVSSFISNIKSIPRIRYTYLIKIRFVLSYVGTCLMRIYYSMIKNYLRFKKNKFSNSR